MTSLGFNFKRIFTQQRPKNPNLVTGLTWFVAANLRELRKIKKDVAAKLKPASQIIAYFSSAQLGLTRTKPNANNFSAALMLQVIANPYFNFGNNWIACFKWRSRAEYWVVACRNGVLLAGSDVVTSLDEAIARYDDIYFKSTQWDRGFDQARAEPDSFVSQIDVYDVLLKQPPELYAQARLLPASNTRKIIRYGLLAALLTGTAATASWYQTKSEAQKQVVREQLAATAKAEQDRAEIALKLKQREPMAMIAPWLTEPLPTDMLAACEAAQSQYPASLLGWQRAHLRCDATVIAARYARNGASSAPLQIFERNYPNAAATADGNAIDLSVALRLTTTPYAIAGIKRDIRSTLISAGQVLNTPVSVTDVQLAPDVGLGIDDARTKKVEQPRYVTWHTMTFSATVPGFAQAKLFATSPNLRLQSVELNGNNLSLKGNIYAPL